MREVAANLSDRLCLDTSFTAEADHLFFSFLHRQKVRFNDVRTRDADEGLSFFCSRGDQVLRPLVNATPRRTRSAGVVATGPFTDNTRLARSVVTPLPDSVRTSGD
jgi:hypothetical protein